MLNIMALKYTVYKLRKAIIKKLDGDDNETTQIMLNTWINKIYKDKLDW